MLLLLDNAFSVRQKLRNVRFVFEVLKILAEHLNITKVWDNKHLQHKFGTGHVMFWSGR